MRKANAILIFVAIIFCACPVKDCTEPDFTFDLPITILNASNQVKLGDTLWVEAEFTEEWLREQFSDLPEELEFPLGCNLQLFSEESIHEEFPWIACADSFQYVDGLGNRDTKLRNELIYETEISGKDGRFIKKVGFVAQVLGLFVIQFRHCWVEFPKYHRCNPILHADYFVSNFETGGFDEFGIDRFLFSHSENDTLYSGFPLKVIEK